MRPNHCQSLCGRCLYSHHFIVKKICWLLWQEFSLGVGKPSHYLTLVSQCYAKHSLSCGPHNLGFLVMITTTLRIKPEFCSMVSFTHEQGTNLESCPWHQGSEVQRTFLSSGSHNSHLWIWRLTDLQDGFAGGVWGGVYTWPEKNESIWNKILRKKGWDTVCIN